MKKIRLILLLQALVLSALTVNADDDCCSDGTDPSVTCDDGTVVCDASECAPCTIANPDPDPGYCCGPDGTQIATTVPTPSVTDPTSTPGYTTGAAGVVPAAKTTKIMTSISSEVYGSGSGAYRIVYYDVEISTPTSHSLVNVLKESRFQTDGAIDTNNACGDALNRTLTLEGARSVSVGASVSIPLTIGGSIGFSVAHSWVYKPAYTVQCSAPAVSWAMNYYQVYKEEVKLSEGTYTLNYSNQKYVREYKRNFRNSNETLLSSNLVGSPVTGSKVDNNVVNSPWGWDGASRCATASSPCCDEEV
ncbi:hypothetical protein QEH59_17595 [Coraliomargarita sp. SDUM461004]|uniref:Uncharacterized protein n=1 Tax=Thalassobacterium sedimentorum TaxID=3041258 RepID=A0ABU1ARM0_9BACT|nr:hypothetical protein [Coraliomargarita sp. SDUM461004]MDQ8196253.1 hypothetical protein [Coraliomargarita sp. SDUM461004]